MKISNMRKGFTLIELSIVLVIIGLIVAGVLAGQNLVRSAQLQNVTTEYNNFNTALGAFRVTYGALPGDVQGVAEFGFPAPADGGSGNGNNNNLINDSTGSVVDLQDDETVFFWSHLGTGGADLIGGFYSGDAVTNATTNLGDILPRSEVGSFWGVYSAGGVNYFMLGGTTSDTGSNYTTLNALTPLDARSIDEKIDDARPGRGVVQARGAAASDPDTVPTHNTSATVAACTTGATAGANATYSAGITTPECTLRFRFGI